MNKNERKALKKELGSKGVAKRMANLSRYDATKELVTFHADEVTVDEMAAYVEFASRLNRRHPGLYFSGGTLRVEKNYSQLVDTVLDNEDRKRRYGY
jgi:hypothetical protein